MTADDAAVPATASWVLYLLECRGERFYAGITNDLERRIQAHRDGTGAKFTRAHPPVRLLATQPHADRASASRAEWAVKQLPKQRKLAFFENEAAQQEAPAPEEERPRMR